MHSRRQPTPTPSQPHHTRPAATSLGPAQTSQNSGSGEPEMDSDLAKNIDYEITFTWREQLAMRQQVQGTIHLLSMQPMEEAVRSDLHARGHLLRAGATMLLTLQEPPQILQAGVVKKKSKPGRAKIVGLVVEQKVNLPGHFASSPKLFYGSFLSGLIIANENGSISWNLPVDIDGIDFCRPQLFKIERDSFEISAQEKIVPLLTDVLVQFYRLPTCMQKHLDSKGHAWAQHQLNKRVQKKDGCRFVGYDQQTGHWFLQIFLSKMMKCQNLTKEPSDMLGTVQYQ